LEASQELGRFRRLVELLLEWHGQNARRLPWRETSDPYKLLVAEKLLQQTRAEQALHAYLKIVERWPTPCDLSKASPRSLERVLKPLGFYRFRARELVRMAESLCRGGVSETGLKLLPGVGDYISAAVLAGCFGRPVLAVDTNISRLLARVLHAREALTRQEAKRYCTAFSPILEEFGPRAVNYALLDFSSAVCKRAGPRCGECPVSGMCGYFQRISPAPLKAR